MSPDSRSTPFRLAAIDMGSNALRLAIAQLDNDGSLKPIENQRVALRLGHDVFLSGKLSEGTITAAASALKTFHQAALAHGVTHYRAVATSAVRDAENRQELLSRIKAEAEIDVEPISGTEEARLVHRAITSRVSMGRDRWLCADLGGGSLEISLVDDAGILWSESYAMGAVRLLEVLSDPGHDSSRLNPLLEEYTEALRIPILASQNQMGGFIATGGGIETLTRLVMDVSGSEPVRLPIQRLRGMIETLSRLSYAQRIEQLGLRSDRADIILPAALVYERLGRLAGVTEILVPFTGLKEGLLLDLTDSIRDPGKREKKKDQQLHAASLVFGRRYLFDEGHALHVQNLSLELFDAFKDLHGLGRPERKILSVAALLHDVGCFISVKRHHRHSQYLIAHSDLPGLQARETSLAAQVARFHRKSPPGSKHPEFVVLPEKDRRIVEKLAALLRVADALDREHLQKVRIAKIERMSGKLALHLQGKGDFLLERWAVARKVGLFSQIFGQEILVRIRDG